MEFLHALSPCWVLSESCVPRWEAWAVVVAVVAVQVGVLAIGATVFLGIMTLSLGRAANSATAAALALAEAEANARRLAEENERLMILASITAEIALAESKVQRAIATLEGWGWLAFSESVNKQRWAFDGMTYFSFPVCESYKDRIHLFGQPVASRLVRAVGMGRTLNSFEFDYTQSDSETKGTQFHLLIVRLKVMDQDLAAVSAECVSAGEKAGIRISV